jgi:hypothetical protein
MKEEVRMDDPSLFAGRQRQLPEEVSRSRRANALVRPFARRFEDWNHRAAKASAHAISHLSSAEERAAQEQVLAMLYREVEAANHDFEQAVAGQPEHGRINDIRNAFARLIATLRPWGIGNG